MLIDDIKLSLRVKSNTFDNEITDLINACLTDLKLSGIKNIKDTDFLIRRAVSIYVKANFGLNNPDIEKLNRAYNNMKNFLTLVNEYTGEINDGM